MSGKWIVVVDHSPDDKALFGFFASETEAQEFIYDAHDPDDEDDGGHLLMDDVEYASVAYVNVVRP